MVHIPTLQLLAEAKGLNRSDLAKLAGVSRQAVSIWFRNVGESGNVTLKSPHLLSLAAGLGISPTMLSRPLPGLEDRARLTTVLLWDQLFPSLNEFLLALSRSDLRAIARLVDRWGLFRAAKIVGSSVWNDFPRYERFLHPIRKPLLRRLWQLQHSLGLI